MHTGRGADAGPFGAAFMSQPEIFLPLWLYHAPAGLANAFAAKGFFIKSYKFCGIAGDDVGMHVAQHVASGN